MHLRRKRTLTLICILLLLMLLSFGLHYYKTQDLIWSAIMVASLILAVIPLLALTKGKREEVRLMRCGVLQLDQMSGEQFEEYLLVYFHSLGYNAELTRLSGDFGADLILEKDGERIAVQAKRWDSVVGVSAVQQVVGALKHYNAKYGMVITTNYFTKNAKALARSNNIVLWDRDYLINNTSKIPLLDNLSKVLNYGGCPLCKSQLTYSKWERGYVVYCSDYPRCNYAVVQSLDRSNR